MSVARERGRLLANGRGGSSLVDVFREDNLCEKLLVGPENGDDFFKNVAVARAW